MSYAWLRITSSQVVSKVSVLVGSVIVTPDASNTNADVTLYDGESTSDPQIITVRSGSGITDQVIMSPPLLCQRGLYVAVGSNVEECLVQYEPQKI